MGAQLKYVKVRFEKSFGITIGAEHDLMGRMLLSGDKWETYRDMEATHCSLFREGLLEAACQMLEKCSEGQILHGLSIWNFCVGFFLLPHFVPLLGHWKALFISLQAIKSLLCRSLSH